MIIKIIRKRLRANRRRLRANRKRFRANRQKLRTNRLIAKLQKPKIKRGILINREFIDFLKESINKIIDTIDKNKKKVKNEN